MNYLWMNWQMFQSRLRSTGIAYPYYNLEPRSVPAQPVDCKQNGTFIVTVNIHVKDGLLLKQTSAERLWVIQGKKMWEGVFLNTDIRRKQDVIKFTSRDCNAPFELQPTVNSQYDLDNSVWTKTIIKLKYAGKTYLLRLPDSIVGAVY